MSFPDEEELSRLAQLLLLTDVIVESYYIRRYMERESPREGSPTSVDCKYEELVSSEEAKEFFRKAVAYTLQELYQGELGKGVWEKLAKLRQEQEES